MVDLKSKIRTIPNFPKEGIMFRDITTLLLDPEGFKHSVDLLVERYKDQRIDKIVGIESRGFIFGAALAYLLGIGFVLVRKPGKLPGKTTKKEYELEYGKDALEIHTDAIAEGERVLIVDDLIATAGTLRAAVDLVKEMKGEIVECVCIIELPDLKGREKMEDTPVFSLVSFEGE